MLPIILRPDGRRAVIVGGGDVAARKADSLRAAGFPILVIAPSLKPALRESLERNGDAFEQRDYTVGDLQGAALVVAATGVDSVDAQIVAEARAAGTLVCDATHPQRGSFTMSATLRRGDLVIAVDSGGGSPAFSKRVLEDLDAAIDPLYERAASTLARMRAYAKVTVEESAARTSIMREFARLPLAQLAAMNPSQAEHEVEAAMARLQAKPPATVTTLRCVSRASALAMAQTRTIAARLAERGIASTITTVTTTGDRERDRSIESLGTTNVFVTELEEALREGRADYAVHSCKDLPSALSPDLTLAAIAAREDPRDAFCSERYARFEDLPSGAIVGTSSPRRRLLLASMRPDLEYRTLRGNVDTRLRKLREGEFDAVVLAMAGLNRLRLRATYTVPFDVETVVPAVAQGALAIETRAADAHVAAELRAAVNDAGSEICVRCERAALRALRAGCSAPIGIHAYAEGATLRVVGAYALADGEVRRQALGAPLLGVAEAEELGERLAAVLRPRLEGRTLVLGRTQPRPSRLAEALRELGATVVELRAGDAGPDPAEGTPDMLLFPSSGSVAAAQTYLARLQASERRPLVAAMGPSSAAAASQAGFAAD
ncbi:MAG: hydroxymethylbilane synthase, partial [Candidatus Eremiobacteraeota bacterium]|nr:hydroxymethylbilane synthase [Candidatus Eremiobacteraeota bacterium]